MRQVKIGNIHTFGVGMKLSSGYKDIFKISLPIMLGSAVQNVIALTDSIFLYHLDQTDFAAIGFVSVYYLIVAGIGYGFSKGGQILIARRMGQERYERVGSTFYSLVFFELCMAVLMWAMLYFLSPFIFSSLIDSAEIYEKSLEYIRPRSWGVFFSYVGVAFVALYTGIARTWFIVVDTLILAVVNIVLNYGFIYGNFGLPSLGIAGAGWASSISEVVAFAVFAIYMIKDPALKTLKMGTWTGIDTRQMRTMFSIGSPIVVQTIIGMGSWFVFFGLIENLGERALAITNLARIIYLILSIPCWGFSSGINTLVSNAVGAKEYGEVWKVTVKTVRVTVFSTLLIGLPVLIFPSIFLYPLLGSDDMSLIVEAQPVFFVLLSILAMFSTGIILLNALTGIGRTLLALKLQFYATAAYMLYVYWVIKQTTLGLVWAWGSELIYWILIIAASGYFLYGDKWRKNGSRKSIEG